MTRVTVILVAVSAVIGSLSAQQSATFEVVSIKRSPPDAPPGRASLQPGGRYVMTNGPTRLLINLAYPTQTNEIVNAPDWVTYENYDVEAVATPAATDGQMAAMMRATLAERFKLVAHYENRQRLVYTLLLARQDGKLGPNIQRSVNCAGDAVKTPPKPPAPDGTLAACTARVTRGSIEASGFSMEALASNLAGPAGRVVLDRTGLTGDYDFTLRYSNWRHATAHRTVNRLCSPHYVSSWV